ncbi:hypothetical protein NPIL_529101, partial [Nephila pilipes]
MSYSMFWRNSNAENIMNLTEVFLRCGIFIITASFLMSLVLMYSEFPNSDRWSTLGIAAVCVIFVSFFVMQ